MTAWRWALGVLLIGAVLGGCAVRPSQDQTLLPIASAVTTEARVAHTQGPCVSLLSATEASNLSEMTVTAPNCFFYINDTANMSYSTIEAAQILYSGAPPNEAGAQFPEATPAPAPPVSDPCSTIRSCAYLTKHPPPTSGCSPGSFVGNGLTIGGAGEVTCFSSLTISGTNETVCGLIEITGSQLHLNGASIHSCSSGVTFAMSSNADDLTFSSSTLTLSPPRAGKYKHMLFYRVSSQSAAVNFSNCACDFAGILYFPTAAVSYTSSGDKYQLLIFGQVNFSTSNMRFGNPP